MLWNIKKPELVFVLKQMASNIVCGMHSGIPHCCIKFFVTEWVYVLPKSSENKFYAYYWKQMQNAQTFSINPQTNELEQDCQYIPCPECLKYRQYIKIKSCPDDSCKVLRKNWNYGINSKTNIVFELE